MQVWQKQTLTGQKQTLMWQKQTLRRDVTNPMRTPRHGRGQATAHAAELREVLDDGDRPKNSLLPHCSTAPTAHGNMYTPFHESS